LEDTFFTLHRILLGDQMKEGDKVKNSGLKIGRKDSASGSQVSVID